MFQLVIIAQLLQNAISATKLSLVGPNPQYMDCKKINENYNGFIGSQFFYDQLSQSTTLINLDKITFEMWFWVHSTMILQGRQVLFSFVDGNSDSPYLNLMLYYYQDQNGYYSLSLLNKNLFPDVFTLRLDQTNDLYKESWNYVLLSIDQSTAHTFINLKFFSTFNYQLQQRQETLVSQKLNFQFGPQSRITNEQLYGITQDYMACVNIANFNYINGWITMDSEIFVDYDFQQVFSLKPFASTGLAVNQIYDQILLKSFPIDVEYSGTIGLNIYKDTQVVYNFLEQMSSFTFMFWFKPMNIQSNFQFLSLTDDSIIETSIGFGVDKNGKLLLYQIFSKSQIANINQNSWNHVVASFLEISKNVNYITTNQEKMLRIYIGNNQVYLQTIQNIKPYKRLVLGPVFVDDKGTEMIDIQDIRIFNGYGIQQSNGDCLLFIGLYCAVCKSGTDYCFERNPYDDTQVYNCPGGYKEENGFCVTIPMPNCRRYDNNACQQCDTGFYFVSGQCVKQNQAELSPFYCSDFDAQFCSNIIKKNLSQNPSITNISKLCKNSFYNSNNFYCNWNNVAFCSISQFNYQCFRCANGYALTQSKVCKSSCNFNKDDRFQDGYQCVLKCPNKYLFQYVCDGNYIDYECNPNFNCGQNELDIGYYCLTQQQQTIGRTVGCKRIYGGVYYNKQIECHYSCKYCFGSSDKNCLGCYSNKYFSPYTTSCLSNCNSNSNKFKYSNKFKMSCELECPSYLFTQDQECVDACSSGYVLYKKQCLLTNSVPELYATTTSINNYYGVQVSIQIYNLCPSLCSECTSSTFCKTCLNTYPIYQNQCLISCYPKYLYVDNKNLNICLDSCDPTDLIFQNDNLYGFSLKQCFKNNCGTIQANKNYQTFQHQSNNKICSYPCDDGYYGHPVTLLCTPCSSTCATCLDYANYCTSCNPMQFLQDSDCFDTCKSKFQNYITWTCEGSCSQGFAVQNKKSGIKACVETCGQIYATYVYSLNGYCYETKPIEKAYCINFNCYNCHPSCKQCSGSLSNQCLVCFPQTYLLNNSCVKDCGSKKYDTINWQCVDQCPQSSYESSGTATVNSIVKTITTCSSTCQFNKYQLKDQCYNTIPIGANCELRINYYYCDKCSDICATCVQNFPTKCLSCPTNTYLLNNICYTDCPDTAPYKNDINKTCVVTCSNYQEDGYCVGACKITSYTYASKKQCFSAGCPFGTYIKVNTQECYECYLGCSSCIGGGSSDCLSCNTNYYFDQGNSCKLSCLIDPDLLQDQVNWKCVSTCPDGTFLQSQANGELVCKANCPQYYYSNICVSSCPNQTFLDGISCKSCAEPCSVCFGVNVNQCNACDIGYYKIDTTCYEKCPPIKPFIILLDQTCSDTCPNYTNLEKMVCFDLCPGFLYYYELSGKKECVDNCYSKSYLSQGHCYACNNICKECYGPDNGNCTQCELPYFLNQQTCGLQCPLFYDTIDHVCKDACPVNSVIQGQLCQTQCDIGYVLFNQVCLITCPSFSYQIDDQCYDCHQFCDTCFGPTSTSCNSCIEDYFLNNKTCQDKCDKYYDKEDRLCLDNCNTKLEVPDIQLCVSSCPSEYLICEQQCLKVLNDGYYQDGIQCQKCDTKCAKCTSLTQCQACNINFYLEVQSCVNKCTNQYLYMDPISRSCVTKCPSQLFHLESYGKRFCVDDCSFKLLDQCVDACPMGMYSDNKICKKCSITCQECTSPTECSSCQTGYYLENGSCILTCLFNLTDRVNIKCVEQCDSNLYVFQNECLSNCPTSPLSYQNQKLCTSNCPTRTYLDEQECFDCDISCTECIGPTNGDCISCNDGYYLNNQICSTTCPDFFDMVDLKCIKSCPDSLFIDQNKCVAQCDKYTFQQICVSSCPSQTYEYNLICYNCSDNCLTCNHNGCLVCGNQTYLNDGLCSSFCPILYNEQTYECINICLDEMYQYIDHCYTTCPPTTFQYKQSCLLTCPTLTVLNNNVCEECPERCSQCLNQNQCQKCNNSYYLYDGLCYVTCPLIMPYTDIQNGVCLSQCTPDTYTKQFECVKSCDLIIHQNQCIDQCPSGYYGKDICKPCKLECKLCNDYDTCTECNENYFLEFNQCDTQCTKIKDIQKKQCVDTCDQLLYKNVCYSNCPINTYQFNEICVIKCTDGYYGSDLLKCEKCSIKCSICSTLTKCSKCKTGYFLYQNECLEECSNELYGDPILNECSNKCPIKTYSHQNQCVYNCPENYYNDSLNYKCVQNCSTQQYLIKNTCYQCSIECDGCYAEGNNNCLKCQSDYKLDENGYCQGQNCKVGYYKSENSCLKCPHKCQTCENDSSCTKCRGNNRQSSDCQCEVGYYDNEFYENCQKCPCDECTSEDNCLICKNNLQLPKCSCDRQLNNEWCINCSVGKVDIYFSEDLNQIIVYFGYLVTVNLINPFQPSDCSQWFDNSEQFGTNSTCYLSWDRYSIKINLKPYSQINIGDELLFKQNFYRDIDKGLCDQEFISIFIENKVHGPNALTRPHVEFSIPQFVSACKEIEIKQILLSGTAQKLQKVLFWQLGNMDNEEYYLQMATFLALQSDEIFIPINTLQPNTTYKITAKYMNMLERVNYTTFTFTTLPIQAPHVYLTFEPLIANIYVFDCHISFSDMNISFFIQIDIVNKADPLINYITQQEQINPIYKVQLNETLLPKETPLIFRCSTGSSIIIGNFVLTSKQIEIEFLQKNRFIGLDNQINARGYDRNIKDQILSTKDINYEWLCTNLHNLQPCKTDENKIMEFPSRRIANIYADSQNTTLVFYVKASKQNRWSVKEQMIVVTDFNIEEEFFYNNDIPKNYINPNDEITIVIKNQQNYAFILQKHKVLLSQKIVGSTLKFRLSDYSTNIIDPLFIYLVPGKESIAFQLNNPPPKINFTIFPLIGKALDYFNYTIENLDEGSKVNIYYYFDNATLENDVNKQQTLNGIPLVINSIELNGQFQLPNGIGDNQIAVLCQVTVVYGAKSFYSQQVQVLRQNYQLSNLISSFTVDSNQTSSLNSLHTMITIIQLEQDQVCLKQCSGVGTCINQKCECPPGYYFDDCSGNQYQYSKFLQLIQNASQQIMKQNITNNDEFKLFTQTLNYLTLFKDINEYISIQDCLQILKQYISNTNSRLEQINQYQLNLQYYSTGDFNFSQIDIRSIVNYNDLNDAIKSTVFMWNEILFSQDSQIYQLSNYFEQFINNIIDLSLISMTFDQEIQFTVDVADIKIKKTSNLTKILNSIDNQQTRILSNEQINYYDVILAVYIGNFYAQDGYFPYPDQRYPLYDYSIRNSNKKQNIELSNNISFKFGIQNNTFNLVCLTRNQTTFQWQNDFCQMSKINSTYFCNCSILAPTTIVNDILYLYQGDYPFYLKLPNIFYFVYSFQFIILLIIIYLAKNKKDMNSRDNVKYGQVFKLLKNKKILGFNKELKNMNDQQNNFNNKKNELLPIKNNHSEFKFHFNQFWKYHELTSIIYNPKFYLSLHVRIIHQLIKLNLTAIVGQFLVILNFSLLIVFLSTFGCVIFLRIIEKLINKQLKYFSYRKQNIVLFIIECVLWIMFFSTLFFLIMLNFQIKNQTNLIISYTASIFIDWVLLDITVFTVNRFLGQERKKQIRDKLKIFNQHVISINH